MYERKQADTRRRIVDAAVDLLVEKGYDHLTVTDIANRADVGRGTVYRYYKDKEALVLQIFTDYYERIEAETFKRMETLESPQKEYAAWQIAFEKAQVLRPIFQNMNRADSQVLIRKFEEISYQHFKASLERNNFRYPQMMGLPVDVMAAFSAGAANSILRRWHNGELDYTPAELAAMVHKLLYHQAPDPMPTET